MSEQKLQEEIRAQQPHIERIVQLANEILDGCHPNAVRFVRYYLTITRTRWEQLLSRAEQRAARLQEALKTARGSAALLEELLTWLTDAHALLTAKDRDQVSDDLTVVEALLKEHQVGWLLPLLTTDLLMSAVYFIIYTILANS